MIKCHVALTPTWNESAWFADYVLPMGHAGERHDVDGIARAGFATRSANSKWLYEISHKNPAQS